MEALDDILKKRSSWTVMLDLLRPYIAPQNERMIRPAETARSSHQKPSVLRYQRLRADAV